MADHRLLHGFFDQDGAAYLEELEEALLLQGIAADTKPFPAARPETLEIFPSWPMRIQRGGAAVGIEKIEICDFLRIEIGSEDGNWQSGGNSESGSGQKAISQLESESGGSRKDDFSDPFWEKQRKQQLLTQQQPFGSKAETAGRLLQQSRVQDNKMRQTAQKDGRSLDAKTLRRLAQNREAARKSRLRKKAYVQQLESSRMKLAQLEQDLRRARSQGFLVTGGCTGGGLSSGAAIFDLEYAQWLDENYKHMAELQGGLQAHLPDGNLRVIVDECLKHYDEIFRLKDVAVKSDVFHLITGMWTTPAERCFLWVGGFRPSDLLKILMPHLDPLTEQQIVGICNLQQSSQQAEEALSQGMDQLQQSLADTVARGYLCEDSNVGNYMGQMAVALGKIRDIEGFVRQADNLRQQTLHQLRRILTIRQTARCFLAIGEHNSRLRALSSLWSSRPRENSVVNENDYPATTNLQILQPLDAHFSVF